MIYTWLDDRWYITSDTPKKYGKMDAHTTLNVSLAPTFYTTEATWLTALSGLGITPREEAVATPTTLPERYLLI